MKNSITKILTLSFALSLSVFLPACNGNDGAPILSFLVNNRMVVILKGTFASDSPLEFNQINSNALFTDNDNVDQSIEALDIFGLPQYDQLKLLLDIGEIRLSTKNFLQGLENIRSPDDSEDFWDVVSTDRQVYCSQLYATNFSNDSCYNTGGAINFIEFMNGRGALYPSRDVGPGTYLHAGVYIRNFTTGHGRIDGASTEARFDNNRIFEATNILPYLHYDPTTTSVEQQLLSPQWFPLHHAATWGQQLQLHLDDSFTSAVLEIRFNIKENLMVHSFLNTDNTQQTMVSISDWRKAHDNQTSLGGNVLTRARIFYPDFTKDVHVTGGSEDGTNRHYYAIYIANVCVDSNGSVICDKNNSQLPLAATPVRASANVLKNISAGHYVIQCLYDTRHDGFPETVLGETNFWVTPGVGLPVSVNCPCGHSTTSGC